MRSPDRLEVEEAIKFQNACNHNGLSECDREWLYTGDNLTQIRRLRRGYYALAIPEHIIDCNAAPRVPNDWKVIEHVKGGMWKWNPAAIDFYVDPSQKKRQKDEYVFTGGEQLHEVLKKMTLLNANVLDFLVANPHLIPDEWYEREPINFWGTVYCDSSGPLVRCLYYWGSKWESRYGWIKFACGGTSPAAVLRAS